MGELQFAPTQGKIDFAQALKDFDLSKSIWQRNYYEHIIRNEQSLHRISTYIQNNPANREKDQFC